MLNELASFCYINLQREIKVYGKTTMTILIALFVVAWTAAAILGTQAYFRGEQTKPIHERNWRSDSFEQLAKSFTGKEIDYSERVFAYTIDTYNSRNLV